MSQHQFTTTRNERVEAAVAAVRKGRGVLVVDDEDRENEGDIIFSAASITHEQMALLIRECSGIVCLCLPEDKVRQLDMPQMVTNNTCKNRTAFTISIEAAEGVTTGVSAADRVKTIRTAIADDAVPGDLNHPGHVFPLCARSGGVRERAGHTEASVDLMRLAGLPPYGVLCELTNPDGTMARLPEIMAFSQLHDMPVLPFRAVMDVLVRLESEAAGGAPVCVAIVNRTGKLAAFLSLDGTPERAGAIAQSKAYTAMRMELTTQAFHDRLVRENLSIADFCDPGFSTLPGGVPVFDETGRCIGGVGISGRKPQEDAELAERLAQKLMGKG